MYKKIDHLDEHLLPSDRKFFPANPKERTRSRFLACVPVVYEILRDANERYRMKVEFDKFWNQCLAYLTKCDYSDVAFMVEGELFYRQSFNFWRKEFRDSLDGLGIMHLWFKTCFGIIGNDEFCIIHDPTGITFDWRKMRACYRDR